MFFEAVAYEAAAPLDRLINGERPPKVPQRISPKGVATRKSTDVLAIEDTTVGAALRYIQENFGRGNLSVDHVVAYCSVSRPSLERAFRQELRRTVLHEILRVRVNQAQRLLETTSLVG